METVESVGYAGDVSDLENSGFVPPAQLDMLAEAAEKMGQ